MKLPISCPICTHDSVLSGRPPFTSWTIVDVRQDNLYTLTCSFGHSTEAVVQNEQFELLFESGAIAIIDGYYREAVAAFAAALERTYQLFTSAVLLQRGIDAEQIKLAAKIVHTSERELGAFVLCYVSEVGSTPPLLRNASVKFRNKVVHQGLFPSKEEAVDFGQEVLTLIEGLTHLMRTRYSSAVETLSWHRVSAHGSPVPGIRRSTVYLSTILSPNDESEPGRPLTEHLDGLDRKYNFLMPFLT